MTQSFTSVPTTIDIAFDDDFANSPSRLSSCVGHDNSLALKKLEVSHRIDERKKLEVSHRIDERKISTLQNIYSRITWHLLLDQNEIEPLTCESIARNKEERLVIIPWSTASVVYKYADTSLADTKAEQATPLHQSPIPTEWQKDMLPRPDALPKFNTAEIKQSLG